MRALVKREAAPGIWMEQVPEPEMGHNDVLIRVRKTSICGTDIHIYDWDPWARRTIPVPMVVGHEYMGEIVAVGSEVERLRPGLRVSGEGHVTCGHCRNCRGGRSHLCRNTVAVGVDRPGAFAEYLRLPARNCYPLPESIGDEVAAVLDPLGNAVHSALSFDLVGEDVLIAGAGPIGVMAAGIARRAGARLVVVTDVNDYRLGLARQMGATCAVNVAREPLQGVMEGLAMKEGFDVGLEMSGSPEAIAELLGAMVHGGRVALLGIPHAELAVDWSRIIFKGLTLKGIYGREQFETWYKAIALLQTGLDLGPVITHRFPAGDYREAFEIMRSGRSGKVILDWT